MDVILRLVSYYCAIIYYYIVSIVIKFFYVSSLIFVFRKQPFKYLIVTHSKPTLYIKILEYPGELYTGRFFSEASLEGRNLDL